MQTALTIAGFDPSSGAGITADLAVFAAHELNGIAAITALTVQSTAGVRAVHPVTPAILRDTLSCLEADLPPSGIKLGMLATAPLVSVVCDYLEVTRNRAPRSTIVLDPVVRATSGRELIDPAGLALLRQRLLPLVDWVTPNLDELSVLSGEPILGPQNLEPAARKLQRTMGQLGICVTGGHLKSPDDLLVPYDGPSTWLRGTRIQTRATHGTGCAFSSAFLANLTQGTPPELAARNAKLYLEGALRHAVETGNGPCKMNHLWEFPQRQL